MRLRSIWSTTAPTGSSSPARQGRARRSPTTSASSSTRRHSTRSATTRRRRGHGHLRHGHSVHLTERAHELGVDACLIVTPYYSKPPQRGIVEHFKAIAAVTDKPIVVYNIPSRVVINIEPATITQPGGDRQREGGQAGERRPRRGAAHRRLRARPLRGRRRPDPAVPRARRRRRRLRAHARRRAAGEGAGQAAGRPASTRRPARSTRSSSRRSSSCASSNPIAIKSALSQLGHEVGGYRLPLVEATQDERDRVRDCLSRLGLLQPAAV